jgi:chromosome segregation ATPase
MLEYRHNSDGEVSRLEEERDSLLEERQKLIELVEREKSKYMAENTRLRSQIALFKSEKEAEILTRRALTADIIPNVADGTADVDSMVDEIKHLHEEIKRLQAKCDIPKQQQEVLRFTGELSVSKDKIAVARKVIHF